MVETACPVYSHHVCSRGRRNLKPVTCVSLFCSLSVLYLLFSAYVCDFLAGFDLIYLNGVPGMHWRYDYAFMVSLKKSESKIRSSFIYRCWSVAPTTTMAYHRNTLFLWGKKSCEDRWRIKQESSAAEHTQRPTNKQE